MTSSAPASLAFAARALDGQVWAHRLTDAEANELAAAWSRCVPLTTSTAEVPRDALDRGTRSWAEFHEKFVHTATSVAIASGRGRDLMFHAAAVAARESGRSIALVADSGTGKTTATKVLGRHFGYVTDETVAVGPDRSIALFPKPLSLLPPTGRRPKAQASPDELGLLPAPERPLLARIALLDRKPGLDAAEARPLSLVEALEYLCPQSSALAALEGGLAQLCTLLEECGGAVRLTYSEAEQLLPVVEDLLSATPARVRYDWEHLAVNVTADPSATGAPPAVGPLQYRRTAADDAVALADGEESAVVVLTGEKLTVLRGLGPLLWEECAGWRSFDELLELVIDAAGAHPQARQILQEHLDALIERGLLESSR